MFKFHDKPFFDPQGNWYIPRNIPWGGQLQPQLKPTEWLLWILDNSLNVPKNAYKDILGASASIWRIRQRLKKKGYETKR